MSESVPDRYFFLLDARQDALVVGLLEAVKVMFSYFYFVFQIGIDSQIFDRDKAAGSESMPIGISSVFAMCPLLLAVGVLKNKRCLLFCWLICSWLCLIICGILFLTLLALCYLNFFIFFTATLIFRGIFAKTIYTHIVVKR